MLISIVIPCFNEELNINKLIKICSDKLNNKNIEIIFVNNGSTDNTKKMFEILIPNYSNFKYINLKNNIGYGNGIYQGLLKAKGDIIGWTHADLETDPNDIIKAIDILKSKSKKVYVKGCRTNRSAIDTFITFCMSLISSFFFLKKLNNINSQPTFFNKELLLKFLNPPNDFSFDLYSFVIAKKNSYKIIRFKVIHSKRKYGQSSWNKNFYSRIKMIKNTLLYIINFKI